MAANIAEAWRKRRYPAAFVSKLSDAESEAAETQTWLEIALRCQYLTLEQAQALDRQCEEILSQLVAMISKPEKVDNSFHDFWTVPLFLVLRPTKSEINRHGVIEN